MRKSEPSQIEEAYEKLWQNVEADGREVYEGYYSLQVEEVDDDKSNYEVALAATCEDKCPELVDLLKK